MVDRVFRRILDTKSSLVAKPSYVNAYMVNGDVETVNSASLGKVRGVVEEPLIMKIIHIRAPNNLKRRGERLAV